MDITLTVQVSIPVTLAYDAMPEMAQLREDAISNFFDHPAIKDARLIEPYIDSIGSGEFNLTEMPKGNRIAEVDFDCSTYLGSVKGGVYFDYAAGPDGWYASAVADSDSGSFVDSILTDDGPHTTEAEALQAAYLTACDWLVTNDVRGWRSDAARVARKIAKMKAGKQ